MPRERFKIIPAVYLVLIKDDKILMLQRQNTGYQDGNYGLPAGHLNGSETLAQAMVREAKEEIGVDLAAENLRLIHLISRKSDDWERVDFFFRAENWQGEPRIMEPEKCGDLQWFPIAELPINIVIEVKQALTKIKSNILYSELW